MEVELFLDLAAGDSTESVRAREASLVLGITTAPECR